MGKYRVKVISTKIHEIEIRSDKMEDAIKIALCDYSGIFPVSIDVQISSVESIEDTDMDKSTTNYWD